MIGAIYCIYMHIYAYMYVHAGIFKYIPCIIKRYTFINPQGDCRRILLARSIVSCVRDS